MQLNHVLSVSIRSSGSEWGEKEVVIGHLRWSSSRLESDPSSTQPLPPVASSIFKPQASREHRTLDINGYEEVNLTTNSLSFDRKTQTKPSPTGEALFCKR